MISSLLFLVLTYLNKYSTPNTKHFQTCSKHLYIGKLVSRFRFRSYLFIMCQKANATFSLFFKLNFLHFIA